MIKPALIGVTGKARSGKDTTAAHLIARYGYVRYAFADVLREAALALDPIIDHVIEEHDYASTLRFLRLSEVVEAEGWEAAKGHPEVRRTLQNYGVAIRAVQPDFWVNVAMRKVDLDFRPAVVTDVRFPNEVDAIRDRGGVLVRVVRPGAVGNGHISETAIDHVTADYTVWNTGSIADLTDALDDMIRTHDLMRTSISPL